MRNGSLGLGNDPEVANDPSPGSLDHLPSLFLSFGDGTVRKITRTATRSAADIYISPVTVRKDGSIYFDATRSIARQNLASLDSYNT